MPRCMRTAIWLLFAIFCASPWSTADSAEHAYVEKSSDGGQLRYEGDVPVLHLQGQPDEIGRQQALLATETVRPMLGLPQQMLSDNGVGLAWPLVVQASRQMFNAAPARYREELEAAGKVAGFTQDDLGTLYVANAMVELRRIGGCSGLVVMPDRSATGDLLVGRNLDVPNVAGIYRLSLVAVYRPAGKFAFISVGFPGLVGVISGMNEKGLCLTTFDSYAAKDNSAIFNPLGVPFALLNRQILEECTTVEEARKLLESSKRTTMMSLMICDAKEAVVFELTPKSVQIRKPVGEVLICTNHFLTPELSVTRECWRYDKLEAYRTRAEKLDRSDIATALHAVNQGDLTLQTMLFEPQAMRLHVSLGSPPSSQHSLQELDAAKLLRHEVGGDGS